MRRENDKVLVKHYTRDDEAALFAVIRSEGSDWEEYYGSGKERYQTALESSVTYVIYDGDVLCGYCRCREDDGFGIYIYDLLVDKSYRGKQYGHRLIAKVYHDFPDEDVYVMSDVDPYYEKLGCQRAGSIFMVKG